GAGRCGCGRATVGGGFSTGGLVRGGWGSTVGPGVGLGNGCRVGRSGGGTGDGELGATMAVSAGGCGGAGGWGTASSSESCGGTATSFGASPEGRTWVRLSAVILAGGCIHSGSSGIGFVGGFGGDRSIVTSIGSSPGTMVGACSASHHRANAATACSTTASTIASGDMRPEVAEGTLATWSIRND